MSNMLLITSIGECQMQKFINAFAGENLQSDEAK